MKKHDADLIIEAIDDKIKGVAEALQSIKVNTDTIPEIHERLATLEDKVDVIEKAVKDTSLQVSSLDGRLSIVEESA